MNNSINIQSLLFIQSIPEINCNHIEVSIVMRIYHGNEVAVCGPVTASRGGGGVVDSFLRFWHASMDLEQYCYFLVSCLWTYLNKWKSQQTEEMPFH